MRGICLRIARPVGFIELGLPGLQGFDAISGASQSAGLAIIRTLQFTIITLVPHMPTIQVFVNEIPGAYLAVERPMMLRIDQL